MSGSVGKSVASCFVSSPLPVPAGSDQTTCCSWTFDILVHSSCLISRMRCLEELTRKLKLLLLCKWFWVCSKEARSYKHNKCTFLRVSETQKHVFLPLFQDCSLDTQIKKTMLFFLHCVTHCRDHCCLSWWASVTFKCLVSWRVVHC